NVSRQFSTGGSVKLQKGNRHIAFNAVFNRFGNEVDRDYKPYNQFDFRGQKLLNASVDYAFMLRNLSFFGETAMSDNGAVASINGLLVGLTPKVDLAVLHRYYPRNYQVLEANPFGETRGGRNEYGLYVGMEIRPLKQWKISGYFDRWHHPWLRFLSNAPSRGHEYRARLTWWAKRKFELYLEVRDEVKQKNFTTAESKTRLIPDHRTFQTRLHFGYNLSKSLTIRSRIDMGFHDNDQEPRSTGVVIYQDIIYKSLDFPLSFSTRFVLMDTDGFSARYYSYENNLLYTFSIPPYYNKGARFYLNLRYRGIRNLTIETRIERTLWTNQTTIGGGLEEIDGNIRTGVSAQVKYKF
ncbi:MAG: helix-hairpin-helix domain-containing protein, partial [Bacteroidetes bacterium]